MTQHSTLRELGLFDARAPRYTSYPPANHFGVDVTPDTMAGWLATVPAGSSVSLYLHIPYCRRLCWFCACRTQGTSTDRPLRAYLDYLKAEMALVDQRLPKDVTLSHVHLGGGTPTLLPPDLLDELGEAIRDFRPMAKSHSVSVEIDPTEVDAPRIDALARMGMTRASIGVQDFDTVVQDCIGRQQSFDQTRDVVDLIRAAGVGSLNMDILYGLPHQTRARMADTVQKVLSLAPDRIALYGYAHVPWMAKRQTLIPADALPNAEERMDLFDTARRLFTWDGFREVGIDHFAREGDSMADADRSRTLRRNFQGYTVDEAEVLIGLGASAISRFPQGYVQNHSTSSKYATAITAGSLAAVRGHVMTPDDRLRARMIEDIMCYFELDLGKLEAAFGTPKAVLQNMVKPMLDRFADAIAQNGDIIRIVKTPRLIARLVAQTLDTFDMPEGRHSRAL